MVFRVLIEAPDENDVYMDIFSELDTSGFECKITPICVDGRVYDFFFHNNLNEAQRFVESMGYEILKNAPTEGIWKKKLFNVK